MRITVALFIGALLMLFNHLTAVNWLTGMMNGLCVAAIFILGIEEGFRAHDDSAV
jgi:hypothetical protein